MNIPVPWKSLEDQPELSILARLQGRGRDRLGINVRLTRPNNRQRKSLDMRWHALLIAEEHLNSDTGDRLWTTISNLAINKGGLPSGKADGFTHHLASDGEARRVGIERKSLIHRRPCVRPASENQSSHKRKHRKTRSSPHTGRQSMFPVRRFRRAGQSQRVRARLLGFRTVRNRCLTQWLAHQARFYLQERPKRATTLGPLTWSVNDHALTGEARKLTNGCYLKLARFER